MYGLQVSKSVRRLVYRPVLRFTPQSHDRLLLRQYLRAYLSNTGTDTPHSQRNIKS